MRRLALVAACGWLALAVGAAADTPAAPDARPYIGPNRLVDIGGGRRLNLVCMGDKGPTVLFDAGGSDWSAIWALVQPALAGETRACSYDRAGLGQSDPARGPRSPAAIADDLHALIEAAHLPRPLVLVGHSLGGFNVKLHAELYPQDVAGLVLVDPAEERTWDRTRAAIQARFGERLAARAELADQDFLALLVQHYRDCGEAARTAALDPASPTYRRCTDPVRPQLGPAIAAERQRLQVTTAYQAAQASEIANSVYGVEGPNQVYARLFRPGSLGDMPMVVLTQGAPSGTDELDVLGDAQGLMLHRETARLSRKGVQSAVPGASHHIELQAPETIVEAVREVIAQGRARP